MTSTSTPRVVMIVGNDVTVDQRVKKIALTVAHAGPEVTVIGLSTTGEQWETMLGPVRIVRVPVRFTNRDWARSGVSKRAAMSPGLRAKQKYLQARTKRKLKQREIQASLGRLSGDRSPSARARSEALRWQNRFIGKWYRLFEVRSQKELEAIRSGRTEASSGLRGRLRRSGSTAWRKALPELHDYELAFGPVIDELQPDVIHAHDVHMIGIAERAVARAELKGRDVKWIYDAHEYVQGLARYSASIVGAWSNLEDEYIHSADRVITVSKPLADLLVEDYDLPRDPDLVLNIPIIRTDLDHAETVREIIGLDDDTPLIVYSGGADATRGVHTLVEAVGKLDGVHVCLVVKARTNYVLSLLEMASEGGYADRVHTVGFVDPDKVVRFLSGATLAVHPMVSNKMNHQIALPNKLFEYLNARLPVVVSDNRAMSDLVTSYGVGAVFTAEDADDLARVIADVFPRVDELRANIEASGVLEDFTWQAQGDRLLEVYRDVLGTGAVQVPAHDIVSLDEVDTDRGHDRVTGSAATKSLLIGPRNSAGQATEWARALQERGVPATSMALDKPGPISFPADLTVAPHRFRELEWQLEQLKRVSAGFTHVLSEGGTSVFGRLNGGFATDDLPFLREHGVSLGIVLHGSEIRVPRIHRGLLEHSPFHVEDELTARLEAATGKLADALDGFGGRVFVTTPDLSEYVPDATWLPVVVDGDTWRPPVQPKSASGKLVVAHVPSSERLKGTEYVDQVCRRLDAEGTIEYVRISGIAPHEVPAHVRRADVVVDGLVLGAYGLMSVQAMAVGTIAVADTSLLGNLRTPIVAATPETLAQTLADLDARRDEFGSLREEGYEFVETYHNGEFAAKVLTGFLEEE